MVCKSGGSLYIVGDFFDFWFEYKHVVPAQYMDVISQFYKLREAGVDMHYVLGNHDYWTNGFFRNALEMHIHPFGTDVKIGDRHVHLIHGDGLLARDRGYRLMRKVLRNPFTIFLYRWLHPDIGVALALSASRFSRQYNPTPENGDIMFEELTDYAAAQWNGGADLVIMGHYHLNRLHFRADGKGFLCLGDWISHYSYGQLRDGQLTLENWPA